MNTGNICIFEGRVVADPKISQIPYNGKQLAKAEFTLAVDRNMSKEQKQKAQTAGKPTSDFPKFEAVGANAEFITKWVKKGKPIRVVAEFETFTYNDKQGNKQYGFKFSVQNIGFTLSDISASNNQNNHVNNNQNNNQQQNSFNTPSSKELPW